MSSRRVAVLAVITVLAAASALLAACSGGSKSAVRTVAPAAEAPVTPVTGVSEVDRIVGAALRGDEIKLAELTQYSRPACTKSPAEPPKIGDPPACAPGESNGTNVEALAVTGCDGGWARPEQAVKAYRGALAGGEAAFVTAYIPKPDGFGAVLGEQYVAVFRLPNAPGGTSELALHITGGRVSWVESACPASADLAAPGRVQETLPLATPSAAASPAATPAASATP